MFVRRIIFVIAVFALSACTPEAIIREVFGAEGDRAVRIAKCESQLNPDAVSSTNDHGIMQINRPTWNKPNHPDPVAQFIGQNWHNVYDARTNAEMALKIRQTYGWQMWSCK